MCLLQAVTLPIQETLPLSYCIFRQPYPQLLSRLHEKFVRNDRTIRRPDSLNRYHLLRKEYQGCPTRLQSFPTGCRCSHTARLFAQPAQHSFISAIYENPNNHWGGHDTCQIYCQLYIDFSLF